MITEHDLRGLRQAAVDAHSTWKQEILLCDEVAAGSWRILWPDLSVESSEPLVENIYSQALEDKTISAGGIPLRLHTKPTRGTRRDQGEKNAAKRKRVGLSYWEKSNFTKMRQRLFRDWYHTGVMAGAPWADGFAGPSPALPHLRDAYFQTINPRHLYPLGWDNRGRLVAGMIIRRRRIADLKADWGDHPSILTAEFRHKDKSHKQLLWLEEIWYFDKSQWGVAVGDASIDTIHQGGLFAPSDAQGNMVIEWIAAPSFHLLGSCPLKAVARTTHNDSPRGALVDTIPQLRVAQNFMARLLDDLNMAIYAPVVLDNVQNPEEFGLGAVMVGTGQSKADIVRDRPPVNFEAQQTVQSILDQTRRQAFEPAQRSGDFGASIASAKGVNAVLGTFNGELATAQADCETLIGDLTSATAALDEVWCPGLKSPDEMNGESYDPAEVFNGDWKFTASYGEHTGLDMQQHLTQLALVKNLGGISTRSFMERSGMVDDSLDEETEMALEQMVAAFYGALLPRQLEAGDTRAAVAAWKKIDADKKTAREAALEALEEVAIAATDGSKPSPTSPQGRADIMRLVRSLGSGGVPGQAEGQPQSQLPGADQRLVANMAPGGGNAV